MKQILSKIDKLIIASTKKEEGSIDLDLLKQIKTELVLNTKTKGKIASEQVVIKKMIKQNLKAENEFMAAGRDDLARKEREEAITLKKIFAEEETTEEDIKRSIEKARSIGKTNIGDIMVYLKQNLPDADMKTAFNLAKNEKE